MIINKAFICFERKNGSLDKLFKMEVFIDLNIFKEDQLKQLQENINRVYSQMIGKKNPIIFLQSEDNNIFYLDNSINLGKFK